MVEKRVGSRFNRIFPIWATEVSKRKFIEETKNGVHKFWPPASGS